jgi:hypothetical protein
LNSYFATVSVKHENTISNTVKIFVKNRAPIVDSLRVGDTVINVKTDVFGTLMYTCVLDTESNVSLRIACSDPDPKDKSALNVSWRANDSTRLTWDRVTNTTAIYHAPVTVFKDTIRVRVYDGHFGEMNLGVILYRPSSNQKPRIDSIVVNTRYYTSTDLNYLYDATVAETLTIKLYDADPDNNIQSRIWSLGAGGMGTLTPLSTGYTTTGYIQSQYICAATKRIDTVKIVVKDSKNLSVAKNIVVTVNNLPPVIDSIRLGSDTTFVVHQAADSVFRFSAAAPDSFSLRLYARDPDADVFATLWQVKRVTGASNTNVQLINYLGLNETYNDTVSIVITDPRGATCRKKLFFNFTKP